MQGSGVLVPAPSSPKLLGSGSRGGPLRTLEGVGHRHARAGTWRLPRREEVRAGRRSLSKGRGSLPRIHGPSPDKPRSSPRERPGKPRHVQRGRGHGNPSAHRPGPRATPASAAVSASELLIVRPRLAGSAQFPDASVVLGEEGKNPCLGKARH